MNKDAFHAKYTVADYSSNLGEHLNHNAILKAITFFLTRKPKCELLTEISQKTRAVRDYAEHPKDERNVVYGLCQMQVVRDENTEVPRLLFDKLNFTTTLKDFLNLYSIGVDAPVPMNHQNKILIK